jgi:hypothetical protein
LIHDHIHRNSHLLALVAPPLAIAIWFVLHWEFIRAQNPGPLEGQ